ncbi:MAG: flagellar biosynthesis protein FlhA [Pseudomonadota bacterium]
MANPNEKVVALPLLTENSDVILAVAVMGILVVMIIPLPTPLLDLLLSFNITFSLIVILVAMYTLKPLEFSVFPSLLLVVTLFRLSLNVASTRLILLHGNEGTGAAGQVIKAFGSFVVGGNYVVGLIVFLMLVIINFVVITKGAGRIAEVAARFTLDAMPGKQMSIDADLNAGLIDDEEARKRRMTISQEADFYGAMDGASKFVRGDAIAGILITIINIVGGFVIGVFQQGMSFSVAVQNYTILTIGDGLVSQVPALIVSTAAGIVVTRAASDTNLGREISTQILVHPRATGIASLILFLFALIPGLPHIPFFILASLVGAVAVTTFRARRAEGEDEKKRLDQVAKKRTPEKVDSLLTLDVLELEVGYGLIPLVDVDQDGELLERVKSIRRQFAIDMGIIVPPIHIKDNLQLKPGEYSILLRGNEIARGELMMGHYLAMNASGSEIEIDGIATKEPAFGLPAFWIKEKEKEKAQFAGFTVVEPSIVLATHLSEVVKYRCHELLGRQEVQALLDNGSRNYPKVLEELIPNLLSLGGVQSVLKNLLKEQVPIKDLLTILETLADYAPITKDTNFLTEYVRQALARTITKQHQTPAGEIQLITLDPRLEEILADSIQQSEQGFYMAIEPNLAHRVLSQLNQALEKAFPVSYQPVVLCSPLIRRHFKSLTERFIPKLVVLSPNEIADNVKIQSVGVVRLPDAS